MAPLSSEANFSGGLPDLSRVTSLETKGILGQGLAEDQFTLLGIHKSTHDLSKGNLTNEEFPLLKNTDQDRLGLPRTATSRKLNSLVSKNQLQILDPQEPPFTNDLINLSISQQQAITFCVNTTHVEQSKCNNQPTVQHFLSEEEVGGFSKINKMDIKSTLSNKMNKDELVNRKTTLTQTHQDNTCTVTNEKYNCILGQFETPIYWGNLLGIVILHILALYGILTFDIIRDWWDVVYGFIIGGIGGIGITAGAHRYWTHRSFKAKLPLKLILLVCYSLAGQNTLLEWVRDHRVHHKYSETDADPHNANRGFIFSHVGWLCMKKHPEVYRRGKNVDLSDITSDPLLAFHIRYWIWFKMFFCFIIPTAIPPLFFGRSWTTIFWLNCIIRYTLNLNFTWSVNSFAHIWGNKPYNKAIQPVENKFVSIIALGEGWHNYHHSFPWDYRAAELGVPLNITTTWINLFAKIGWAYDLKTTSPELVNAMVKRKGDGSHHTLRQCYIK